MHSFSLVLAHAVMFQASLTLHISRTDRTPCTMGCLSGITHKHGERPWGLDTEGGTKPGVQLVQYEYSFTVWNPFVRATCTCKAHRTLRDQALATSAVAASTTCHGFTAFLPMAGGLCVHNSAGSWVS